ncbi:Trafficking protein particle complex subunit 4 [Auxenochlorella protothecoides]|uniref:Trafficking protein particle complex subunit n=1 Tax=Auxenochlorella protothecoides TaxID=3075 RepID=A0A087SKN3_AUXPR|nr:Trafficking protein particle complex subunit 4 [Auxenochlorella protothecoides]KFM26287.1 Trafficking protein particle complex subunit 4 [Auxenochlorella protothecoides]
MKPPPLLTSFLALSGTAEIKLMQADNFDLHSFQTLTGTMFMMITQPNTPESAETLRGPVYELYADYVLKNPFHEMDQVIKAELFDSHLVATLSASNRKWGAA